MLTLPRSRCLSGGYLQKCHIIRIDVTLTDLAINVMAFIRKYVKGSEIDRLMDGRADVRTDTKQILSAILRTAIDDYDEDMNDDDKAQWQKIRSFQK